MKLPDDYDNEDVIAHEISQTEAVYLEAMALLRQILPEWADEVHESNGCACCEISNRDVIMIRDFLKNTQLPTQQ